MLALLGVGADALEDYSDELHAADEAGIAAKITQEKLNSVWGQWKLMVSAVSGVVIEAVEMMIGSVRGLQSGFLSFFNDVQQRQRLVEGLAGIFRRTTEVVGSLTTFMVNMAPAIGTVFGLMGKVVGVFARFLQQNPAVLAAFLAFKTAQLMGVIPALMSTIRWLGVMISTMGVSPIKAVWS